MPVDEYLTGLSRALSGPRRRKADLLAEARDHLVDATEAFESDGLDRESAEREAVADFGDLTEVVPGYRAELAVSQSRRTAMLLFLALMIQPIVWHDGWKWNRDTAERSALSLQLDTLVEIVGVLSIAGAILAVIAAGAGMRYPAVRERVSRTTAVFALMSSVAISLIGLGMGLSSSRPNHLADFSAVGGFVVLPLVLVGLQAGRCLRLSRA
jgi:uncharacterized protein YfiM (DUF2279 family)